MRTKIFTVLIALLSVGLSGFCQDPIILTVTQPDPLQVNAGSGKQINKGESTTIGGNPSASQGYGSYVYSWTPTTGLNDPTLANPTAAPETNTTYLLTVTDAMNCSVTDEVTITVEASGIETNLNTLEIRCYPNPVREELLIEMKGLPTEVTMRLINTMGSELIYKSAQMSGSKLTERIPMRNLPEGLYILQFLTPNAIQYQRILKTR